jgi:DNA-binding protein HU-beta
VAVTVAGPSNATGYAVSSTRVKRSVGVGNKRREESRMAREGARNSEKSTISLVSMCMAVPYSATMCSMNKRELAKAVAVQADVELKTVTAVLEGFTDVVTTVVSKGETISIPGFAKFVKVNRAARMGRNPATGETIRIKASKKARITPVKAFKDAVLAPALAPKLKPGVFPTNDAAVAAAGKSAAATPAKAAAKAPAKKAPARKAVAKKAPAKKAPVKRAPAKKAVTRKAPAKKAPAKRAVKR